MGWECSWGGYYVTRNNGLYGSSGVVSIVRLGGCDGLGK